MAADHATLIGLAEAGHQRGLGGAHVGDDRVGGSGRQRGRDVLLRASVPAWRQRQGRPRRRPLPASAHAWVMAPRSSASFSVASVRLKPVTWRTPAWVRAARPREPPMRPTPMTAMRSCRVLRVGHVESRPRSGERLAGELHQLADAARILAEGRRRQRLRPVAERELRIGVHLDDHAVGAGRDGRQRERQHQVEAAGGVARVDDHRQVAGELDDGHRADVQRVARGRLEGADAALAEDDVAVALP